MTIRIFSRLIAITMFALTASADKLAEALDSALTFENSGSCLWQVGGDLGSTGKPSIRAFLSSSERVAELRTQIMVESPTAELSFLWCTSKSASSYVFEGRFDVLVDDEPIVSVFSALPTKVWVAPI